MTVDIVCAAYNGARFLPEFLQSLERQTHADWRLWVRDDGSGDTSVAIIEADAARDTRVRLVVEPAPSRLGAAQSFGRLLEKAEVDAAYVMFADQDDVWLPHKIERSLAEMRLAEQAAPNGSATPVLVHTNLIVTDESLQTIHPSFWEFANVRPAPMSLRRLAVHNPVTGAATIINRALRERVGTMPREAVFHDWWCALVAAAFGRIVAIDEPTILYRQHGTNAVGAKDGRFPLSRLPAAIISRLGNVAEFRRGLDRSAAQAGAFLERYGAELPETEQTFLRDYAALPRQSLVQRKIDLLRLRTFPEFGVLRTLGVLFRG